MSSDTAALQRVLDERAAERRAEKTAGQQASDLDVLRGASVRGRKIAADYATALREAHKLDRDELGAEYVRKAFAKAESDAGARVRTWVKGQDGGDVNTQLLTEQREQRAWTRLRGQLEAGRRADDLVAEAREAGDTAALSALRAELPAWHDANQRDEAAERVGLGAGLTGRADVSAMIREVDEALLSTLPRDQARVVEARLGLADAEPSIAAALEHAGRAVSDWTPDDLDRPQVPERLRKEWLMTDMRADPSYKVEVRDGDGVVHTEQGGATSEEGAA